MNRTQSMNSSTPSNADQLMKQAGLDQEQLQLLVDAKNGDKAAIAKLIVDSKMDTDDFDLDMADSYKPTWQPDLMSEADVVAQRIMAEPELGEKVKATFGQVPSDFSELIVGNAAALSDFANHVKTGLADKIIPQAKKMMALDGVDFATAYTTIGEEMIQRWWGSCWYNINRNVNLVRKQKR